METVLMSQNLLKQKWQTIAGEPLVNPEDTANCLVDLSELGIIEVSGEDAGSFLQGQITCNMDSLEETARHGAYANVKGRVQSGFIIYKFGDSFFLVLPDDNVEATHNQLKKYAMFSKVELAMNPPRLMLLGVIGEPSLPEGTNRVTIANTDRSLLVIPDSAALEKLSGRAAATLDAWLLKDIQQGIVTISNSVSEEYTIQAINFDLIHAVDFDKGCYLGQEVIARAHFRGKTKQRTARFTAAGSVQTGSKVLDENDQSAGEIINAVELSNGSYECLANVKLNSLSGNLTCEGYMLDRQELPYSLEESS